MNAFILIVILEIFILIFQVGVFLLHRKTKIKRENEYYTDYFHNNLILRIYKPEFEYQAIGSVSREKLLDRGTFSQFYMWALISK